MAQALRSAFHSGSFQRAVGTEQKQLSSRQNASGFSSSFPSSVCAVEADLEPERHHLRGGARRSSPKHGWEGWETPVPLRAMIPCGSCSPHYKTRQSTELLVPENTHQWRPVNQTHPSPTGGSEEATGYYTEEPCGSNQGQEESKSSCPHPVSQRPHNRIHKKLRRAQSVRLQEIRLF